MRFDTLVTWPTGDDVQYVVRTSAPRTGSSRRSCPSRSLDNGSGMHTHQSLWKNGVPLFYDKAGYAGISEMCRCTSAACEARAVAARLRPRRPRIVSPGWCQATRHR